MDERRSHLRYPLWFPVTLEHAETAIGAICRDASGSGVLISSVAPVAIGESVRVTFRLRPADPDRVLEGRVARLEGNDDELLLAFPYRLAVEFANEAEDLPDALRARTDQSERSLAR